MISVSASKGFVQVFLSDGFDQAFFARFFPNLKLTKSMELNGYEFKPLGFVYAGNTVDNLPVAKTGWGAAQFCARQKVTFDPKKNKFVPMLPVHTWQRTANENDFVSLDFPLPTLDCPSFTASYDIVRGLWMITRWGA